MNIYVSFHYDFLTSFMLICRRRFVRKSNRLLCIHSTSFMLIISHLWPSARRSSA